MTASPTTSTVRTYTIDPTHSAVHFSVRHLMISKVRGAFTTLSGTLQIPVGGTIPQAVSAEIDAASIETHDEQRDGHLRSADFLDVEKFPKLRFTSTRIESTGPQAFTLTGDLELHGVTRPVTLKAEVSGQGKDPWGNERIAYEATARVNRKDFGLAWNQALETGGVMVGEDIDITFDIESIGAP